jgi:hypothetical protein
MIVFMLFRTARILRAHESEASETLAVQKSMSGPEARGPGRL